MQRRVSLLHIGCMGIACDASRAASRATTVNGPTSRFPATESSLAASGFEGTRESDLRAEDRASLGGRYFPGYSPSVVVRGVPLALPLAYP